MEWTKTFIAQKTITGSFADFFNDHIVEVRKHKTVGRKVVYDLYCKAVQGNGCLSRETSILVPINLTKPKSDFTADEELELFRQLATDGKITEDMLDRTL